LSAVGVNAAPEATPLGWILPELVRFIKGMTKSSSSRLVVPSAYLGAHHYGTDSHAPSLVKSSSAVEPIKVSDMIKEVPVLASQIIEPMVDAEERIPAAELEKLASACGSHRGVLSNMGAMGIVLSPEEFSDLVGMGEPPQVLQSADVRRGFTQGSSALASGDALRPHVLASLQKYLPSRSILYPHMANRAAAVAVQEQPRTRRRGQQVCPHTAAPYGSYLREMSLSMHTLVKALIEGYPQLDPGSAGCPIHKTTLRRQDMSAQALLPSAYILHKASSLDLTNHLLQSVDSLNAPGVAHLFGGVYGEQL